MGSSDLKKVSAKKMTEKMRQSLQSFHVNPGPADYTFTTNSFENLETMDAA